MKTRAEIPVREMHVEELHACLTRVESGAGTPEDRDKLRAALATLGFLQDLIRSKELSIERLRSLIFGAMTEKTADLVGEKKNAEASTDGNQDEKKAPRKGHGRRPAAAYTGAERIKVPHQTLKHGGPCPHCSGKVYATAQPSCLVRLVGTPPVSGTVYERESLRCNACGEVFKAEPPPGVGNEKYDASVSATIALFKYGAGVPFNRLEKLQAGWGIPLPAGTQWELVAYAADQADPVFRELIRLAAQAEVLHNDDTTMKILHVDRLPPSEDGASRKQRKRTGIFTSGIIARAFVGRSVVERPMIALFFTGIKHAGENLADLLALREKDRDAPIQMCDALSRNSPGGDFERFLANCIPHGRRKFVEVMEHFPDECRFVLDELAKVFHNDAIAREKGFDPEERLRFHQAESGEVMRALKEWFTAQIEERKVEPNSGLGEAIEYMLDHWTELTLFLEKPGAPLENNICERALKKAILNRKNAYFYRTENGARVGDIFMSLIHTAELNNENPFEYLVALQRHAETAAAAPSEWMPWNYRAALANLTPGSDPPET